MTWVFEEGTFKPSAKITSEQRYSILTDYLGTPVQMYDGQGELSWQAQLDVYGKVRTFTGASATDCPFRYQGQYEDSETGLYYNRFRYYSPEMGGYISQDPIGLEGGNPTLYGYVKDTNSWLDPFGLDCHHIATNKNKEWSDKFRDLFKKYGFGKFKNGKQRKDVLNDPRNKVDVSGHKGPHSEEGFHENIYERLENAGNMGGGSGFEAELAKMNIECTTLGSDINKIITKTY